MAKLADALDSKSSEGHPSCGFESHLRHQPREAGGINVSRIKNLILSCLLIQAILPSLAKAQSIEESIAEAVLAAPASLRNGATVIVRDPRGIPKVVRQGTNTLVCEPDGPQSGFAVECYHESFKPVMDWTYKRLAEGVRSFAEMFADGGPDVNIAPGSMQYALVGPSREQAVQRMQIKVPYATSESTGLSTTERPNGPWLMWAGTAAAHIMFEKRPPGVPFDYPGQ